MKGLTMCSIYSSIHEGRQWLTKRTEGFYQDAGTAEDATTAKKILPTAWHQLILPQSGKDLFLLIH